MGGWLPRRTNRRLPSWRCAGLRRGGDPVSTDIDIPTWLLGAIAAFIFGLAAVIARSMFNTVRRATLVVDTNQRLRETIDAQAECIRALEMQVKSVLTDLASANRRIADLERIIQDEHTVRDIKSRRVRAANEDAR